MKKLQQLQSEFKYEIERNKIFFYKNLNIPIDNKKINESFSKINLNSNRLIRNSSMGDFTLKRDNSLKELINKTENRTKYLPRNNSRILKSIENIKKKILDNKNSSRSNREYIKNFIHNKENSFLNSNVNHNINSFFNTINLKKKNYFGKTSKLLNEQNYSNKDNSSMNKIINSSFYRLNNKESSFDNSFYNIKKNDRKSFLNIDD